MESAAVTKEIEDLHDDHNNYTELVCDVAYLILQNAVL